MSDNFSRESTPLSSADLSELISTIAGMPDGERITDDGQPDTSQATALLLGMLFSLAHRLDTQHRHCGSPMSAETDGIVQRILDHGVLIQETWHRALD